MSLFGFREAIGEVVGAVFGGVAEEVDRAIDGVFGGIGDEMKKGLADALTSDKHWLTEEGGGPAGEAGSSE